MRLLIADDEAYAREGLLDAIDWEACGIHEIMLAADGREALSIASWFSPEIVLTDIRMPKLNGIEFAEKLLRQCPDSKLLFMSGYMEIEYLKKAISLDAVEFVEKPIDIRKLEAAVQKAVSFIKEKERQEHTEEQWLHLERQRLLNILKLKHKDRALVEKICHELGFPTDALYLPLIVWDRTEKGTANMEQILEKYWEQNGLQCLITLRGSGQYLLLIPFGEYQKSLVQSGCRRLLEELPSVTIGMGFQVDNLMAVAQSCEIAVLNMEQSFFHNDRRIFEIKGKIPELKKLNPSLFSEFLQLLQKEPERVKGWLEELRREICGEGFYRMDEIKMLFTVFSKLVIQEKGAVLLAVEGVYTQEDMENQIAEAGSLDQAWELTEKLLDVFLAQTEAETGYSKLIRDTIQFVEAHCNEQELSVNDIAKGMNFSAAHLNVLFRKETGITIKQYISDYRLNLSKKLLRNEHMKIVEIAERCGFSNANYFAKFFRNAVGMSPLEYRQKENGDNVP